MRYGYRIGGKKVVMTKEYLDKAVSVKGSIYEIQMKTEPYDIGKGEEIVSLLTEKLYEEFNANVLYVELGGDYIILQIEGSPFSWAALLPFLPEILMAIGIIVTAISVLLVIQKAPWEVFGIIIGLVLALKSKEIAEGIGRMIKGVK